MRIVGKTRFKEGGESEIGLPARPIRFMYLTTKVDFAVAEERRVVILGVAFVGGVEVKRRKEKSGACPRV
jgi:hypothetical protein